MFHSAVVEFLILPILNLLDKRLLSVPHETWLCKIPLKSSTLVWRISTPSPFNQRRRRIILMLRLNLIYIQHKLVFQIRYLCIFIFNQYCFAILIIFILLSYGLDNIFNFRLGVILYLIVGHHAITLCIDRITAKHVYISI